MTPNNHELVDGIGQCPYCKEYFKVKLEEDCPNERIQDRYRK